MTQKPDNRLLDELSQQFLRAVRMTCGGDVGSETVNALEPVLGKEWKDRLILHKLSGTYQTTNTISFVLVDREMYENSRNGHTMSLKITAIKELRAMCSMGLIEAKRTIEAAEQTRQLATLSQGQRDDNPLAWERAMLGSIDTLRQCGFEVNYA